MKLHKSVEYHKCLDVFARFLVCSCEKKKEWMSNVFDVFLKWANFRDNDICGIKNEWMFVMWMLIWTSLEFSENLFPSNEIRVEFHLSCCCYSCVAAKHVKKLARGFLVFVRGKIMETLRAESQLRNALKYPFFSQSWHFRPCIFMVRGFRDFEMKYQAFCDWYLILFISLLDLHLVWH